MPLKHPLPNPISRFVFLSGLMWFALSFNFLGAQTVTYSTSGPGTFLVPDGVTTISVSVWGAGGGGGYNVGNGGAASGGGGAFTFAASYPVTAGANIPFVVGLGGTGQVPAGNATAGFPSTFGSTGTPAQVFASGGGRAGNNIAGNGGNPTFGPYVYIGGGNGETAATSADSNGAGGGAAGSSSGAGANGFSSGAGGIGVNGAGDGGAGGIVSSQNGKNGSQPGGGGGGEGHNGTSGGNGGDGQIIITWTCSNTLTSAASTENQPICVGTAIEDITYTIIGATGATFSGFPPGVTGAYVGGLVTISGTPTAAAAGNTYNYTVTPTGFCTSSISTGTITVTAPPSAGTLSGNQNICEAGTTTFSSDETGGVWSTSNAAIATINASTGVISGIAAGTATMTYTVTGSGGCADATATRTVTVTAPPSAGTLSGTQAICIGGTSTFSSTATGGSWISSNPAIATINASTGLVTGIAAGPATMTYTVTGSGGCADATATRTITVDPLATVGTASVAYPSVCISSPNLTPFTQQTMGVTSIGQDGIPGANGLPDGIFASFQITNPTTGEGLITFSGTATTPTVGAQSYSIPLIGDCDNGLVATGTIEVSPDYQLTSVNSVSATTIGGNATVTIYGDPTILSNGIYEVEYEIAEGSGSFTQEGPVNVTVSNGQGSFPTIPINDNTATYTVKILTIKKTTDKCTVTLPDPPTTYFGICAAVFQANSTFNVPANVYSITIEVYGGGGGGNSSGAGGGAYSIRTNVPVTPGEPIAVFVGQGGARGGINGQDSYVTRDSNIADQLGNSLVYAEGGLGNGTGGAFDSRYSGENGSNNTGSNGGDAGGPLGNQTGGQSRADGKSPGGGGTRAQGQDGDGGKGLVVISYSCPDADDTDCIKIIDDGTKSGTTVIEYTCSDTWTAPEGLVEFTVYVGSAGGGGGSGEGSGGGGSGALIQQTFSTTNPYGMPAGTSFGIIVGEGGPGAIAGINPGFPGEETSFTGEIDGNSIDIIVPGGGGGGSQSANAGSDGASGGGGGATPAPAKSFGAGGDIIPISYTGTNVIVYQGNIGGLGDYSEPQNSIAGGGGGGLTPWGSGNDGQNGKAAGAGQGEGGRGGDGITLTLGDSLRYYGAGGGGIGEYFNGTEKIGEGGIANGITIGGDGNLDINNTDGVGYPGMDKTGSGGGAGYSGGGKGGNGVVYITFVNVRILQVEYHYFNAEYNSENRSGELTWATSQEWENDRFEIERALASDLSSWTKIGEVKGQGYSDSPSYYSFEDTELPAAGGNILYRLKQIDTDGSFSYSVTRSIQVKGLKGQTTWTVYPNPSSPGTYVTVELLDRSSYRDEQILVKIADVKGTFETYSVRSIEEVSIAVNNYLEQAAPGIHIVQLIWGKHTEQLKVIRR